MFKYGWWSSDRVNIMSYPYPLNVSDCCAAGECNSTAVVAGEIESDRADERTRLSLSEVNREPKGGECKDMQHAFIGHCEWTVCGGGDGGRGLQKELSEESFLWPPLPLLLYWADKNLDIFSVQSLSMLFKQSSPCNS